MTLIEQLTGSLGDRYRIERELGRGGMAVVFLAEDLKHHRPVAIKVLRPELSIRLGSERFLREIAIAATLQHPHILPLFDSGAADGLLYYVMPYVEGESLRERLQREKQLPLDVAFQLTREVAGALQYAHERGVVHRDIKPENIMLSRGQATVTDFGISRALDAAAGQQLTESGMLVGTPQYMSPEQAGNAPVDGRCDQYSLACTLYEMLGGEPPFTGPTAAAILARHSIDPVPSLRTIRRTVSPAAEAAIARALSKQAADRFASLDQFVAALGSPDAPTAAAPAIRMSRRAMRITIAALFVGVLAVAGGWLVTQNAGATAAVVVLPFSDAGDTSGLYLGIGMTEGLIADLSEVGALKVIARPSAESAPRPIADLVRELGVDAVVTGTIQRAGDSVQVSIRMLAADSSTLLTRDYARRLGELPVLQKEIAAGVTGSIRARLTGNERARLDARRGVDQRAYEAWLRGRFHLEQGQLEQARALFEQASRAAPDWAPPNVGLANYYTTLPFSTDVSPADVLPQARAVLARALELDETLAEAHSANAYIRAYYDWDWRGAEREFRRAIELRPSYADAYFSYSRFLAGRRRFDEARAQLARAVDLDPLSLLLQANQALLEYFAGRYEVADSVLREVLRRDSTDLTALWGRALVAEQQQRPGDAVAILERIAGASFNRQSMLGHAYAIAGQTAKAREVLNAFDAAAAQRYVPAYYFALVHAGLGERDQALRYLERAYQERSTVIAYLLIDPRLAPLRSEPRFIALAKRLDGQQ